MFLENFSHEFVKGLVVILMLAVSQFVGHGSSYVLPSMQHVVVLRMPQSQVNGVKGFASGSASKKGGLVVPPNIGAHFAALLGISWSMIQAIPAAAHFADGRYMVSAALNDGAKFVVDSVQYSLAGIALRKIWNDAERNVRWGCISLANRFAVIVAVVIRSYSTCCRFGIVVISEIRCFFVIVVLEIVQSDDSSLS